MVTASPVVRADDATSDTSWATAVRRRPSWMAGVVLERGVHALTERSILDDQLVGLSATYFVQGRFGLHGRLLASPNVSRVVDTRGVSAVGLRLRTELLGVETFLGVGAHAEVRLRTHYWLAYAAPFEVGFTAYRRRSFRVEVFLGARAVVAGDLIDFYLLDPNGVDNVQAGDALTREKRRPWEGYLSIVIGRAM